jgi:hypothetical protein
VKLETVDFAEVSRQMLAESARSEGELKETWREIWAQVIPHQQRPDLTGMTYEARMDAIYGPGKWVEY